MPVQAGGSNAPRQHQTGWFACAVALATTVALAGASPAASTSAAKAPPKTAISKVIAQVEGMKGAARARKLHTLAKQEGGSLSLYTSMTRDVVKQVVGRFESTFPDVKVELYRAGSETVLQKLLEEKSARSFAGPTSSRRTAPSSQRCNPRTI